MKSFVWTIYLLLVILTPVQIIAQGKVVPENILDSIANPPLLQKETVLQFERQSFHFGKISENDAPITCSFSFSNIGVKPVRLTKVVTSCGCTVASFDRQTLQSGEKGTIDVAFNPRGKVGTIDTQVFIYTDLSSQWATTKVALLGEVLLSDNEWSRYPCIMGILRLKRNTVFFNSLAKKSSSVERLVCVNTGKKPLRLSALMIPVYASFHTDPEVIPPGSEADLVIKVDGRKLPETVKDMFKFSIILEGLDTKPSDRTIQVKAMLSR